ncbi:MAG: thiamine-phosphate kinase [Leptolyngbyaceae cyanobacterium SL_7_1]|nr:thiamine-phosphate kinase [Leptolyngbyaceae cyanobacterium SL_7_1]
MNQLTLRDIGEQGLLARLQRFCPAELVGDDAAVLPGVADRALVVTTDMLVDGVHFSVGLANPLRTTSPADVGWRSIAANLSDLAAMGATPIGVTVCLGLPGHVPVAWVEELYEGMSDCLRPFDTPIVGGDICRSEIFTVAIAALGKVYPDQAIRRATAQVGDAILVTGIHGASRAGLELLLHPDQGQGLSIEERAELICAHQRPHPRLDVIPLIQTVRSELAIERAIAGMDSSDGLADAILQICRASGVGAHLDRAAIPFPAAFAHWLSEEHALEWALYGGEDFELVLCLPSEMAVALQARLGSAARIVGAIGAQPDVILHDSLGKQPDRLLTLDQGFQHF